MIKILLALLMLTVPALSQTRPDLSNTVTQCASGIPLAGSGTSLPPICGITSLDLGSGLSAAKLTLYTLSGNQYGFGVNTGELSIFAGTSGNINFRTGSSAGTSLMYLATGGNVGIGTTSPGTPLDVNGAVTHRSTTVLNGAVSGTGVASANTASTLVARDGSGNFSAGTITASLAGTASNVTTNANLTGEVTSTGNATTVTNAAVIGKVLTGYVSGAGTLSAADTILGALQKLNGNDQLKATIASPAFSGVPTAPTATAGTNTTQLATTAFVLANSTITTFANPTASVGLTANNGVATTAMRSDASPAISQAIAPTWTGLHTFGSAGYPTTWSGIGAGTAIKLGTSTLNGTATPNAIDMGGDYSATCGANPKLKLTAASSSIYGLGVCAGFLELQAPTGAAINFYTNGSTTNPTRVNTDGTITAPGITNGSNAAAGKVGEFVSAQSSGVTATVTMTIATPAVVTWTAIPYKGLAAGAGTNWTAPIIFTTTGALPTGITAGTVYWIIGSSVSGNTHQIATSIANALAGTAIATSGTQSGVQSGTASTSLGSGAATDVAAILLSAGDWTVTGNIVNLPAGGTTITYALGWTHTASITNPGAPNNGAFFSQVANIVGIGVTGSTGSQRINITSPTTVYLGALASHSGTVNDYGSISARREQ